MKILAIAGRNLTSLGQFELRLDQPPFDKEGLFAITGPTGAGKSTILDAMCVALYNRIPRLPARDGRALDKEADNPFTKLTLADPRNIMRRGAKSCFAETTFIGVDGHRYKARWEVLPRTRKSSTLNDPSLSLVDLDTGDKFAAKRTEVLSAIADKVGLTFEQFCRSVLLAQGDFAAFLKAGSDERATLLERMTGTEIYKELSIAAHDRGKLEQQKLQELTHRIEAQQLLSVEDRTALQTKLGENERELAALKSAWSRQNEIVTGFQRRNELEAALAKAQQQQQVADGAWLELAGTFRDLHRWERLADCREAYSEMGKLDAKLALLQQKVQDLREALPELEGAVTKTETDWKTSLGQRQNLVQQIEAQKPIRDEARKLDHQLETAKSEHRSFLDKFEKASEDAATTKTALDQYETRFEDLTRQMETSAQSLHDHRHFEPLANAWPQHRDALDRFETLKNEARTNAIAQLQQLWQAGEVEAKSQDTQELLTRVRGGLKAIASEIANQGQSDGGASRTQWHHAQQTLIGKQSALAELRRLQDAAQVLGKEAEKAAHTKTAIEQRRGDHQATLTQGEEERSQLVAKREEAQHQQERLLRASSDTAQALRASLKAGEACPVCGATEHPFAGHRPFDPLLAESKARIGDLDEAIQTWQTRLANAKSESERDEATLLQLEEDAKTRQASWETLESKLAELTLLETSFPELGSEAMTGTVSNIASQLEADASKMAEVLADIERREASQTLLAQSRTLLQERVHRLEVQHTDLAAQRRELQTSRTSLKNSADRFGKALAQLHQSLTSIMAGFPDWQKNLSADAESFFSQLDREITIFINAKTNLETAQKSKHAMEPDLVKLRENHHWQTQKTNELRAGIQEGNTRIETLENQRGGLLEGRAVADVEASNQGALAELDDRIQSQKTVLDQATKTLEEQRIILDQHQVNASEIAAERAIHQTRFEEGLKRLGFVLEEVQDLLDKDSEWMQSCRAALEAAKSALNQAEGAKNEVENQLTEHQKNFQTQGNLEEALSNRETLEQQREALETQLAETRQQLKSDTEARARIGELEQEIEAQRAQTELWESMRELIGSHDGKKFRIFAQSLTLDMLLHHANHHLNDLARRYRLERLPGSDLDLRIIDRDMGDDIRGINSLSGGETFLVSLSLALGLATFTTSQTPIESLFIDEGFGALDSESLDLALDALDALHTQGRQVGVISHVQTLSERIGIQVQVRKRGSGTSSVHIQHQGVDL